MESFINKALTKIYNNSKILKTKEHLDNLFYFFDNTNTIQNSYIITKFLADNTPNLEQLNASTIIIKNHLYKHWIAHPILIEDEELFKKYIKSFSVKQQKQFLDKLKQDIPFYQAEKILPTAKNYSELTLALKDIKINKFEKLAQYIDKSSEITNMDFRRIMNYIDKTEYNNNELLHLCNAMKKTINLDLSLYFLNRNTLKSSPTIFQEHFNVFYTKLQIKIKLLKFNKSWAEDTINGTLWYYYDSFDNGKKVNDIHSFCYTLMYFIGRCNDDNLENCISNLNWMLSQKTPYTDYLSKKRNINLSLNGMYEFYQYCKTHIVLPDFDFNEEYGLDDDDLFLQKTENILLHHKINQKLHYNKNIKKTIKI